MTIARGPSPGASRAVAMLLAVVAGIMPAVQPLLLGPLLAAGRLHAHQLGHAAGIEALGMMAAILGAPWLLPAPRWRRIAAFALALIGAANLVTALAGSGGAIIVLRAGAGLGEGLLLALFLRHAARSPDPARTFAWYVTAQSLGAFAFALAANHAIVRAAGPGGGYAALVVVDVLALAIVPLVRAPEGGAVRRAGGWPPLRGWAALAAAALFFAGIMAFWPYVLPLSQARGQAGAASGLVVPLVIGIHVLGGLAAACLSRLPPVAVCTAGPLAMSACILVAPLAASPRADLAGLAIFAFLWSFVPPFQLPLAIRLDPSMRGAAMLTSGHLAGIVVGPLLAGFAVSTGALTGALWVAIACLALASLLPLLTLTGPAPTPGEQVLGAAEGFEKPYL